MRLSFAILTTAAFALAAPSAEVIRDLPARFAIKTLAAELRANGARVRVQNNGSKCPTADPPSPHIPMLTSPRQCLL